MTEEINAEVISVYPDKVKISIDNLDTFRLAEEHLKVGSYLRIADSDDVVLIAVIDSYSIEVKESGDRKYIIEASPLGVIRDGCFSRGGDSIELLSNLVFSCLNLSGGLINIRYLNPIFEFDSRNHFS